MKEILRETSTNGRWGLSVVSSAEDIDIKAPVRGELQFLGKFEGHETYRFSGRLRSVLPVDLNTDIMTFSSPPRITFSGPDVLIVMADLTSADGKSANHTAPV